MNTKLHAVTDVVTNAVTDTNGRPIRFFITAGQVSDYTGAAALMSTCLQPNGSLLSEGTTPTGFETSL